ncbi:hypothetical protein ACS5PN_10860 [Roseateles sp. NT4]|uniref:hypothetical protein n=1 Tax=Roseateles sp. NT4 TaxID=3453715 RepID=UPI003EE92170
MKSLMPTVLALLCLGGMSHCLADAGCRFTPTLECRADKGCAQRTVPIAESLVLVEDEVATPYLMLCFEGAANQCLKGQATVRRSTEHDRLASSILLNPEGQGGLPKKIFATLMFSWTGEAQHRAALYPVTGGKSPPMYLSAGDCSGAG